MPGKLESLVNLTGNLKTAIKTWHNCYLVLVVYSSFCMWISKPLLSWGRNTSPVVCSQNMMLTNTVKNSSESAHCLCYWYLVQFLNVHFFCVFQWQTWICLLMIFQEVRTCNILFKDSKVWTALCITVHEFLQLGNACTVMAMKEVWPCQQYGFLEAKTWILSGWDEKQAVRSVFLLQDLNENSHFHFIFCQHSFEEIHRARIVKF